MSKNSIKPKLIIGLGNPGKEYNDTWHNVGFAFIDAMREKLEDDFQHSIINKKTYEVTSFPTLKIKLLKPLTFMNNSGVVVADFFKYNKFKVDEVLIVHDDLDIEFGKHKIQKGKYPKAHNGITSIHNKTGKKNFHYLRIGVETREGELKNIPGEKYVLQKVEKGDQKKLNLEFKNIIKDLLDDITSKEQAS